MDKQMRIKRKNGFTLIELLVVLVILGMLGGIVGPKVMKYVSSSKSDVAKVQLADLAAALDMFKLEVGRYPTTKEGLVILVNKPQDIPDWDGPYMRKNKIPNDPWNNKYVYKYPGKTNVYELHTLGMDNQVGGEGEAADISAWD